MGKGAIVFIMDGKGEVNFKSKTKNLNSKEFAEMILFIESYIEVLKSIWRKNRIKFKFKEE